MNLDHYRRYDDLSRYWLRDRRRWQYRPPINRLWRLNAEERRDFIWTRRMNDFLNTIDR